ncbi:WhiB family transcriptional regulator [Nesterenkonia sphaerica]|uniref:Transcriptional regulator WhiB n=1 Tax=Nesterenkonia sphaerica TaxID=1804988 RepID=A0A5R9AE00_9MICC|nr:WhiB family transcriptional regulator [Nesterenkonia sphaerica]TLP76843.1 WhiB family transcriptional regulator [Nesterenkonia sphaerica]
MGKPQRLSEIGPEQDRRAVRRSGLDVPPDWFVDPADPSAGDRLEHGAALEDQATAFLASAEAAAAESHSTVTALSEAPSRRTQLSPGAEDTAASIWQVGPALLPAEQVEGELAWQVDALCAQTDPEAFFPEKGGSTRDAKKVCGACNVKQECLDYALANDERFGIWGGLSERERRKLKRRAR